MLATFPNRGTPVAPNIGLVYCIDSLKVKGWPVLASFLGQSRRFFVSGRQWIDVGAGYVYQSGAVERIDAKELVPPRIERKYLVIARRSGKKGAFGIGNSGYFEISMASIPNVLALKWLIDNVVQ